MDSRGATVSEAPPAAWMAGVTVVLLAFLLASHPSDARLIAYAKHIPCRQLDPALPAIALETWLRSVVGPAARITWETDDCGEGGGGETVLPICVAATSHLVPQGEVSVSVGVGRTDTMAIGPPEYWWGTIERLGPTVLLQASPSGHALSRLPEALREARHTAARLAGLPDRRLTLSQAVEAVSKLPARRLSPTLPEVPFGEWLRSIAGNDSIAWDLWNCEHQRIGGGLDEWADLDISVKDSLTWAIIELRVGTCAKGLVGTPVVRSVSVTSRKPGHIGRRTLPLDELPSLLR